MFPTQYKINIPMSLLRPEGRRTGNRRAYPGVRIDFRACDSVIPRVATQKTVRTQGMHKCRRCRASVLLTSKFSRYEMNLKNSKDLQNGRSEWHRHIGSTEFSHNVNNATYTIFPPSSSTTTKRLGSVVVQPARHPETSSAIITDEERNEDLRLLTLE